MTASYSDISYSFVARSSNTTQRSSVILTDAGSDAASLVVIRGEPFGKAYSMGPEPTLIGRASSCHIQLSQDSVSRVHCQVWGEAGRYHIKDLGSTNRTLVNGRATPAAALADGDRITVGETVFKFVMEDSIEAQYHAELYARATEDPLTGIANRRLFEEVLAREFDVGRRHGQPLSLLVIDVDYFKDVNDTYDHVMGDQVLCQLSEKLSAFAKPMDTVARVGGEEFGLIKPGVGLAEAGRDAEVIRESIGAHPLRVNGRMVSLTISIGVAEFVSRRMVDAWDLFKAADRQLLRAKGKGRNCVCLDDAH